jgi:D-threo-aldose 1-dehydrogenase
MHPFGEKSAADECNSCNARAMTAPTLSRLALGVTGPHASMAVAPDATVALVRAALALGVSAFDTGPMYGDGEGERRLGLALADAAREQVFVSTKARTFPLRGDDGQGRDVPTRLRRSLEGSLRRLRLERVDALFLHGPAVAHLDAGLATLRAMQGEGLVGAVGVCGRGEELDAALERGVDLVMAPVHTALFARVAARGAKALAIETMRGRERVPSSAADVWYLARSARDALTGHAPERGAGIVNALALPGVASVVVQTTRIGHLRENAAAAGLRNDPAT